MYMYMYMYVCIAHRSVSENKSQQDEQDLFHSEGIYLPILTGGLYIIPNVFIRIYNKLSNLIICTDVF